MEGGGGVGYRRRYLTYLSRRRSRKTCAQSAGSATKQVRSPASTSTKHGACMRAELSRMKSSGAWPKATAEPRNGSHDQTTGGSVWGGVDCEASVVFLVNG